MKKSKEDKLRILAQLKGLDMIHDGCLNDQLKALSADINDYDRNYLRFKEEERIKQNELAENFIKILEMRLPPVGSEIREDIEIKANLSFGLI